MGPDPTRVETVVACGPCRVDLGLKLTPAEKLKTVRKTRSDKGKRRKASVASKRAAGPKRVKAKKTVRQLERELIEEVAGAGG
jgi:hypothetical protein